MQLLAGLFLSTTVILSGAAVRDGEAEMTLIVPVPQDSIASVRYGGKQVPLVRKGPAKPARRIVVLAGGGFRLTDELRSARELCPECFSPVTTEVWGAGSKVFDAGLARFKEGWVGVIERNAVPVQGAGTWIAQSPTSSGADVLRVIGETHAGRGPVEVYWLDSSLSWLDARWQSDPSPVYDFAEYLGDAGITVFPVLPKFDRYHTGDLKYGESVLGTRVRRFDDRAKPGETLVHAMREAAANNAQITCIVPAAPKRSKFLHVPPELEVINTTGHVVHRRRIAAEGMKSFFSEGMDSMTQTLYRIVPQVRARSVHLARSCPSVPGIGSGRRYLWLENIEFPRHVKSARQVFEVSVTAMNAGLVSRESNPGPQEKTTRWIQMGHSACVGPLPIEGEMRLGFYQPQEKWAVFLSIERP